MGVIKVESNTTSTNSLDGLDNIGDENSDGFLNNDKDKDNVADTETDRNYTALNAFGVMIQNPFECRVLFQNGQVTPLYLKIGNNVYINK